MTQFLEQVLFNVKVRVSMQAFLMSPCSEEETPEKIISGSDEVTMQNLISLLISLSEN